MELAHYFSVHSGFHIDRMLYDNASSLLSVSVLDGYVCCR